MSHLPPRRAGISKQTQYLQERRNKGVVKIHQHINLFARLCSILYGITGRVSVRVSGLAITVVGCAHLPYDHIILGRADRHFKIAWQFFGIVIGNIDTLVNQQAGGVVVGLGMNGLEPRLCLVNCIQAPTLAVGLVPTARDCVTHRLPGDILDQ